ncbi:DUF4157 domain-containing protein [Pseudanabaena galeata UHCC 0370]|uniref:DUF4157 domain-containing protein n=1 Tax=Pseudanabaena galeata UHCC 0370 TaxID=3110310 RepID=A0ABU5TE76_9CYAN|nr:DUF4157 domain-containing protein [Pseudanabaena galeata]MEA5476391.1 DUF4157 domain-containing protein [Pseudanabaena galeata UHCC 0370]
MSRTYENEKKPSQSTFSFKPTASFLQTRGFAPIQTDLDEDATPRPSGYTENLLEKIINQPSTNSSDTSVQAKPMNHLKRHLQDKRMSMIQAKLSIGEPNDKYEQEADATASKVVQQINSPTQNQSVQKQKSMEEEDELQMRPISSIQREELMEEEDEKLQMKSLVQRRENLVRGEASTDLESSIQSARSSGQSLDPNLQEKMGQAMGADFSSVKVHTDLQSDRLNQSIQAKAFTTGQDVFFRQGAYSPSSKDGQELIAHELTHVVQQSAAPINRQIDDGTVQRHPSPFVAEDEEEKIQRKPIQLQDGAVQKHPSPFMAEDEEEKIQRKPVKPQTQQPLVIQRVFKPATTTSKTHLRKNNNNKAGSKTGRNIPANSEVVVDKDKQYVENKTFGSNITWTRAVDVLPTTWDPISHPNQGGYIRDTKIQEKAYPQDSKVFITFRGDVSCKKRWHVDIGEYLDIEDSRAYAGNRIVKCGESFYRLPTGGKDLMPLNILEKTQVETAKYKLFGPSPSDPNWSIIIVQGANPLKYNTTSHVEDLNPVMTLDETTAIKEKPIKDHMETELAKDPEMQNDLLTTTTIAYKAGKDIDPINIYVKGNAEAKLYADQLASVRKGIEDLAKKNVLLQDGLEIYISSSDKPLQAAYNFGSGHIVLKSTMFNEVEMDEEKSRTEGIRGGVAKGGTFGVAHQIANQLDEPSEQNKKITLGGAVAVHEMGHVMHKLTSPAEFQKLQKGELSEEQLKRLGPAAKKVSQYAATAPGDGNKALEVVAEVFTGITYDQKYPKDVIELYKELGGAQIWKDEKDVIG